MHEVNVDQNEEVNSINSDLIRGHIDTIILKALQAGDRYGYDIIKEIEHKSGGQYVIKQPTLYSCLKRLEVQGFVKSYWGTKSIGGRKKYFTLTDMGRELFQRNKNDWDYSRDVINRLISDDDYSISYPTDQVASTTFNENEVVNSDVTETENTQNAQSIETNIAEDEPEIINGDSYNAVSSYDEDENKGAEENVSTTAYEQLSLFDNTSDDSSLPLSDAEQNQSAMDAVIDDEKADFIDKLYDEQNQESYLSNVGNANYEPPQNNDIIDVNDYFADDNELLDDEVDDEEETVASVAYDEIETKDGAIILPPPEESEPEPIHDDAVILPPPEEVTEEPIHNDAVVLPAEEETPTEPVYDDAIVLPPQEDEKPTTQQYEKNKTVFYDYNKAISEIDEVSTIIDKEYRNVINKLIEDNIVNSEPKKSVEDNKINYAEIDYYNDAANDVLNNAGQNIEENQSAINEQTQSINEQQTPIEQPVKQQESYLNNAVTEADSRDKIDLRVHSTGTIKSYNNKHYYYSNQLRLLQCGILFAIMLLEIVGCFCFIEVMHNGMNITRLNLALYIIAVVIAALFPIVSFFMASTNYYKRKRINYSGKSSAIFSVAATLLLWLIIFFANVYGGILIKEIDGFLSSLIMPMVLATNVIVNAIIFHLLYNSGKYNVKE